jgi:hypothetical protein
MDAACRAKKACRRHMHIMAQDILAQMSGWHTAATTQAQRAATQVMLQLAASCWTRATADAWALAAPCWC